MKLEEIRNKIIDSYFPGSNKPESNKHWIMNDDKSIDLYGNFYLWNPIPAKIRNIYGDLVLNTVYLKTLDNFPDYIDGFCRVMCNTEKFPEEEIRKMCKVNGEINTMSTYTFTHRLSKEQIKFLKSYNKIPS